MAQDYEVARKIWEACVPVEFILETEQSDNTRPYYAMLPRISYLPILMPKILQFFSAHNEDEKLEMDNIWLESNGIAIKTYYPIGVLFDEYKSIDAQSWTVSVKTSAKPDGACVVSKETMEAMFMQSIKEADFLKRKSDDLIMYSLKSEEHKQLWNGVAQHKYEEFWSVNKKLMESQPEQKAWRKIPIRLYVQGKPFRQIPISVEDATGKLNTIADALSELAADLVSSDYIFICHGITLPLDTPLLYAAQNLCYPDNFVHLCARQGQEQ